jgi:hypothetical protein
MFAGAFVFGALEVPKYLFDQGYGGVKKMPAIFTGILLTKSPAR